MSGPRPCLTLPGTATKNHQGVSPPLRADLVRDLVGWLAETGRSGSASLFTVSVELVKILKKDLELAGIPYRDGLSRTVDVHALRHTHTTATLLSRVKVAPRVAQEFMRHPDIKLTMQTYTDHRQLDEAGALAALPELPPGQDAGSTIATDGSSGQTIDAQDGFQGGGEPRRRNWENRTNRPQPPGISTTRPGRRIPVAIPGLIDDAKGFQAARDLRSHDGVSCPCRAPGAAIKCGRDDFREHRQRYQCRDRRRRFDDLTGTVFAGHHRPPRVRIACSYPMGLNLSGPPACAGDRQGGRPVDDHDAPPGDRRPGAAGVAPRRGRVRRSPCGGGR
jgi:hypothetical protein